MGIGLVGGAAQTLVGSPLAGLDEQVGTHGSAAAAVLGAGLMVAAINPRGWVGWVWAGILYGFVVLVFEAGGYFLFKKTFHLGPVIFGLAFSLLLIATYPQRPRREAEAPVASEAEPPEAETRAAHEPDEEPAAAHTDEGKAEKEAS